MKGAKDIHHVAYGHSYRVNKTTVKEVSAALFTVELVSKDTVK